MPPACCGSTARCLPRPPTSASSRAPVVERRELYRFTHVDHTTVRPSWPPSVTRSSPSPASIGWRMRWRPRSPSSSPTAGRSSGSAPSSSDVWPTSSGARCRPVRRRGAAPQPQDARRLPPLGAAGALRAPRRRGPPRRRPLSRSALVVADDRPGLAIEDPGGLAEAADRAQRAAGLDEPAHRSTLGPIEPAARSSGRRRPGRVSRMRRWCGVPQSSYTASTSVRRRSASARSSLARSAAERSLSMTASTPR